MKPVWQPTACQFARTARAGMLSRVREYFSQQGVLEVDTPAFSLATSTDPHVPSMEADNAGQQGFLHTSPEYPMKRLLAAGSGDIYQIAKVFRAGERGKRHNPEFTLLEWYRVGFGLDELIQDVSAVLSRALESPLGPQILSFRQSCIELGGFDPWRDKAVHLRQSLLDAGHSVPGSMGLDEFDGWVDLAFSTLVTPQFDRSNLSFVVGYPASQAALARIEQVEGEPVASRFEAYWGELELANGFHELSDPVEQLQRLHDEQQMASSAGYPVRPVDEHFIAALQSGLPDCSGVAIGLDRVMMVLLQADSIDEVINFAIDRA